MAYDENGNYYFDPNVDEYDREMVQDEHKRKMARDYVDEQQKRAKQQHEFNTLWQETLSEEGLDQTVYDAMIDEDPEAAKAIFRNAARQVAQGVKQGRTRDPKTGQFTSGPPRAGRTPQHRETGPSDERLEALRETAKKRHLSEDESLEAVDHIIGKLF
jgi:hypothetical protein